MMKCCSIESILKAAKMYEPQIFHEYLESDKFAALIKIQELHEKAALTKAKKVAFIAPQLPHPCELEIWNQCVKKLGVEGSLYTHISEERNFIQFAKLLHNSNTPIYLTCYTLDSMNENKTFLSGLEKELEDFQLIIALGENSLASYQAAKVKRSHLSRLIIWQNSPRPPHANIGARSPNGSPLPNIARERTVRKEVLKNSDVVLCFDKDGATWSYLEDVSSQRIRRVSRGINSQRYSSEISSLRRLELRASLGLPETDFIFFHLGPLEIESGALDSVFAFKNLLQSNPLFQGKARLCFCGTGSAGADIRQSIVELGLDDHVYFLNPNGEGLKEIHGNQFSSIIALCDAVIHAPIAPVNGNATKHLDSTYDVMCALASDIIIISNGNNWIGEWVSRFYKTFSAGSIHSLARLMQETIEKQDKVTNVKNAIKKALLNEFPFEKNCNEISEIFKSLIITLPTVEIENTSKLIAQIEEMVIAKQYIDAINLISQAFQKTNLSVIQQATLFRLIGDCFTKLGDLDNGVSNYSKALELDPYCAKCFIGLGTIALQRNNYNIAVPQFQKAVSLAPNDDMASLGLGLAFEGLNELKQALSWTVRACHLKADNTVAIFNLVKLSFEMEQFVDAERVLIRYLGLHPNDVNMIYTLGTIELKTGKNDIALQLMENILTLDPMNSRAHSLIQQIQKQDTMKKPA
ncbi:tetratricopeptide repeat protein [Pigmentibacter sp. JX0631]|uniref:tetratricopeptide repeat protein n=1 Tax=Pigmentibacter sp. JX0631 TaxID=2976982 RepID=UPI002468E7ED|nr:tetratricopeptide repeat protein [Pigmentibacter sp. JX0631]WGL59419.1 tetratricopeptide repeat protein [Pigmentibacter sp. JX0631]